MTSTHFVYIYIPEEDLMELLSEGCEERGEGEDEPAEDGREPGGFSTTKGNYEWSP